MVLSAEDIHNKKFGTKMRGYNIDEVNDFLDQITKDYQILRDENTSLKQELEQTKHDLAYYDDLKSSLNQSILVAQEAADNVKKTADADAEETLKTARHKANQIVAEATQKAQATVEQEAQKAAALALSTDDFRMQIKQFRQKLIGMLESQLEYAHQSDWTKLLDGADYQAFPEIKAVVENLDNHTTERVNSNSNRTLTSDKYEQPTIMFYPDGRVEIL
ncbi:DivIVA domain-containing protein [Fructilactobacillus myrtifloralis]|uniref:DivIVA domain-containing protein n=1 Tax=Fructilactobacillus myrtifloralis TaxID=2940301 RepID=A0ABY5BTD0_9LACO|nr:DivIVA domain-containing protein [Fructilactobacillus myrtifloralis]USS85518.1 DivIVA domain-containing protein [Fructilactobacillus myrtifloralis]